jgi:hypothetical protein
MQKNGVVFFYCLFLIAFGAAAQPTKAKSAINKQPLKQNLRLKGDLN